MPGFIVSPYSQDETGDLSRWMREQFDMFQQAFLQPEWDKRWLGEFALDDTETWDINPVNEFGLVQFSCKEDANTYGIVHYNKSTPFIQAVNIGSNVSTTLTTASRVNIAISGNQLRWENLSGSQRTIRAVAF